jgi:type VI protein secretion system component VasF
MSKLDRLALRYESILTAVSCVRTGRQRVKDVKDFRGSMNPALADADVTATRRGYGRGDIEETKFAAVAFIDEAVLTSLDPCFERFLSE